MPNNEKIGQLFKRLETMEEQARNLSKMLAALTADIYEAQLELGEIWKETEYAQNDD